MFRSSFTKVLALPLFLIPFLAHAESAAPAPQLSNVQIQYVETQLSAEEKGTPRGNIRGLFKKFEPEGKGMLAVSEADVLAAEKVAMENGYLNIPAPLIEGMSRALATYQVASSAKFVSGLRTPEKASESESEINGRLKPSFTQADFVMSVMPYRVEYKDAGDAVVRVGVLLWDVKASRNIWTYYVSIPFSAGQQGFGAAEGDRVASILTGEMVKRGWLQAAASQEKH